MNKKQRILYVQYTNPGGYPPLEHSSRILANNHWDVLFLGTGALGANNLVFPEHPNIKVLLMGFCPAGWRQKLHYLLYLIWVIIWVFYWSPNYIYASDMLSCPIAFILSFIPGLKIIYHEHDSPSPNQIIESLFIKVCLNARTKLAHRAQMCILPNQERADLFSKVTGKNDDVLCVWNCPTKEEMLSLSVGDKNTDLWLHYHGSIVPTQLPPTLLNALAILPEKIKLQIFGYETIGHQGYINELKAISDELGISHRIKFMGSVDTRNELLDMCKTAHIGVSLFQKPTREPMTGASNKPFDYLACGLVLLVSDLPDWQKMYVDSGYGLACDPNNPQSIADALKWFLDHPEQIQIMAEKGRERILNEWNYETQFLPVFTRINTI